MQDAEQTIAEQVGYALRGVTPTCLLSVRGWTPLYIDVAARPITVRPAAGESADLELEMDAADLASLGPGKEPVIEGWIESGRILVRGSRETVARLRDRLHGGVAVWSYAQVDDRIDDPRFVFINHGFVELDGSDEFTWVKPGDEPWRYQMNLIRQLTRGVSLDGARLLDVGCGRGGTCSYFVRYRSPAEVVGVDLVPGHVGFCAATHSAPNLRFQEADAQKLPFDDASFDVVTNIESSHSYPHLDRFFSEVRRVLRPGGVFCYTDNLAAGQVEARTNRLRRYGTVRWVRTITAEVAESLQQCREPMLALVQEIVSDAGGNGPFLERYAQSILQCRNNYVAGAWDYAIWQMERV